MAGIRNATIACKMTPVFCGSSYRNKGVQPLLDAVVDYLRLLRIFLRLKGLIRIPTLKNIAMRMIRLVFRAGIQDHGGPVCRQADIFPCIFGDNDQRIVRIQFDKREKRAHRTYPANACEPPGRHRHCLHRGYCRSCWIQGHGHGRPPSVRTKTRSFWNRWYFRNRLFPSRLNPKPRLTRKKWALPCSAWQKKTRHSGCIPTRKQGQTIIEGMGELHLEIIVDRLLREFRVDCTVGRPQVAYRETIRKTVKSEGKFIRQSGGRGQYGHCWLEISPQEPGQGFVFENKVVGGAIPREYINPIEAGAKEAMDSGSIADIRWWTSGHGV